MIRVRRKINGGVCSNIQKSSKKGADMRDDY